MVDFTTYQFNVKAQTLDAFDGGHTTVSWCPDYLLQPVNRIRGHADVAMALRPGVAYYEVRPELESAAQYVLDPEDLRNARLILANPDATVFGRYHLPRDAVPKGELTP